MRIRITGDRTVSPTRNKIPFSLPSEAHSVCHILLQFHRLQLSVRRSGQTYLLFFIGLLG